MRWVGAAFVSEGSTDDRFLPKIIDRTLVDLCLERFVDDVDVAGTVVVRDRRGPAPIGDIITALRHNAGSYNLVVVHHDAGANRARTEREWLTPLREAWARDGTGDPLVPIVPVRETESWALADGDAIRRAYGVSWTDDRLGIPTDPRAVRDVPDPRLVFAAIRDATRGHRIDYHSRIGELISLDRLAKVEAFLDWREQVARVLQHDLKLTRQG